MQNYITMFYKCSSIQLAIAIVKQIGSGHKNPNQINHQHQNFAAVSKLPCVTNVLLNNKQDVNLRSLIYKRKMTKIFN